MFTRSEVIVLTNTHTHTHTNKKTPLQTPNALRYATTLGINPFKSSDAKWLHFKVFSAILV